MRSAQWDVIIVGAGVAGASLAYALGNEGRRVLLLERDLSEPVRIVGELLQPGGYLKLKELGLEHCVDGIDAQKVYGYAMYKDDGEALVGYPLEGRGDDVAGRSFHNGRFVMRLREAAKGCPNVDVRQATVKKLLAEDGEEWTDGTTIGGVATAVDEKEQRFFAPLTVVCDGYFSSFRKKLTPAASPVSPSTFVGIILDGDPNDLLPRPGHGHVVLGDPSPVLFYPISSKEVRCLVDIPAHVKMPSVASGAMAEYVMTKIVPQVPEKLRAPLVKAVEGGQFKSMMNKTMPAQPSPHARSRASRRRLQHAPSAHRRRDDGGVFRRRDDAIDAEPVALLRGRRRGGRARGRLLRTPHATRAHDQHARQRAVQGVLRHGGFAAWRRCVARASSTCDWVGPCLRDRSPSSEDSRPIR